MPNNNETNSPVNPVNEIRGFFFSLSVNEEDDAHSLIDQLHQIHTVPELIAWLENFNNNITGYLFDLDDLIPLDNMADGYENNEPGLYDALRAITENVGAIEMYALLASEDFAIENPLPPVSPGNEEVKEEVANNVSIFSNACIAGIIAAFMETIS